jgi:puromycin-sensitive aminopeptidase
MRLGETTGSALKCDWWVGNTLGVSSSTSPTAAPTPVSPVLSAATTAAKAGSSEAMAYPANPYRLPRTALPTRYDLTLSPDLHKRDFLGDARITLNVTEPIAEVVCNSLDLEIVKAWVVDANGTRIDAKATADPERERVSFALERTLWAGTAVLHVQFHGVLNDKLVGFYASTYEAADGSTKVIATTQMEATDARRAFPCWDEPDCKAVFALTLLVDDGLLAVSNMHEISSTTLSSGKRSVRFADTPVMSTYLVAMVVGELEATEPVDVGGIALRVIARPGTLDQAPFALEVGAFALRYFQDWYGIAYPGTKLDLIATPDFAFGAMENLGAVTFRETLLLIDEAKASRGDLERAADVISHEIAHMWFGDLVTMKWWNGLWLNEAFATFAETSCCAAFRPEWERWTSFALSRTMAQVVDALHSTRPIEFPVISPTDAEGMFDVLTYEKGASVLRMLEQYLGEERFRDGVRHYLSAHSFANAETTDLWDSIEHVSGEPIRETMDGWIFTGGFPLVSVSFDGTAGQLHLTQKRFLYTPNSGEISAEATTWKVPVLYRAIGADGAASEGRVLLGGEGATLAIPVGTAAVLVNAGGHGFYRVHYNAAALGALHSLLPKLAAVERYQIVSDTWASVLAGELRAQSFVDLTAAFGSERDANVWSAILGGLRELNAVVDEDGREILAARVRALLLPVLTELGWHPVAGESSLTGELRGQIIGALGGLGSAPEVLSALDAKLGAVIAGDGTVPPDVAPALITLGARHGNAARYAQYQSARTTAATTQEERRFLMAMGQFVEPALVARTLAATLTDEFRSQDAPMLLTTMLAHRENGPASWTFVRDNWAAMVERFPQNLLPRMVEGIQNLTDPLVEPEVRAFFTNGTGSALAARTKTIQQNLERLGVNAGLRQREEHALS